MGAVLEVAARGVVYVLMGGPPKPKDDLAYWCEAACGKKTTNWYHLWPKTQHIYYRCEECRDVSFEEIQKRCETWDERKQN